jgi:hypothetical protein
MEDQMSTHECPECGEEAVNQPTTDLVPWEAHGMERPQWSHRDGSSLCPVIGPSGGYEPAQPRERDDDVIGDFYDNYRAGREPQTEVEAGWHQHWAQQSPEEREITEDWVIHADEERENPYPPFTAEHRVWEIAQSTLGLADEEVARHAGWVPHDGTLLRDDLIAQYRRESAGMEQHQQTILKDTWGPGIAREVETEPDERQVMSWAEHDAHADGLEPETGE